MDAQQFLAEFGHIANAPFGGARLREMVLQLAISGWLVERGTSDTAVSESLALGSLERQKYEGELSLRAARPHDPITTSPYAIPEHWEWVRLEQLALYIQRGKGPKYADSGSVWVISQKCIRWAGFDLKQARFIADDSIAEYGQERFLCEGDLLWNSTGTGTAGRVAIYPACKEEQCVADSHVTVVRLNQAATSRYLWCVIASPWVQARIHPAHPDSLVSGTTQQVELATSTVRALSIPCPPLEEQARIVAKVDELMALCDTLETQQQERRRLRNALRQSTLQAVAAAASPRELETNWARLDNNFGTLFSEPGDVSELRTLLLKLAVRGLLTEQFATDSPAEQSLAAMREIATATKQVGRRRGSGAYSQVAEDELPYPLPKGWSLARLGELVRVLNGRAYSKPELLNKGTPVLRVGNLFTSRDWYYSDLDLEADKYCEEGDLLYAWSASFGPFIWKGPKVIFHYHIWKMDLFSDQYLNKDYLFNVLQERTEAIKSSGHGVAMAHMTKEKMEKLPVAVPPLEEQSRIVVRVRELVQVCDRLEADLHSAREVAGRLAAAAVASLTGISLEPDEDEPVKAPPTELIAPLRLSAPPDVHDQAPLATLLVRHNGELSARDLWQRFGGEIDAFYAQLKTEVAHGWIAEPDKAELREVAAAPAGA